MARFPSKTNMQSRRGDEVVVTANENAALSDSARNRFMENWVVLVESGVPTLLPRRMLDEALRLGLKVNDGATEGVEPLSVNQNRDKRRVLEHLGRPHQTTYDDLRVKYEGEAGAGRLTSIACARAIAQVVHHGVDEQVAISELNGLRDTISEQALSNASKRLLAEYVPEVASTVFKINVPGTTEASAPYPDDVQISNVDELISDEIVPPVEVER